MTVTPLNRSAEPPAFDDFYRHYFVRVLALVRRHFPRCDAEEIAQETMARCFTNYDTLDHGRDPWPWVNSVARNAAIDSMRRNRRNIPSDEVPEVALGTEDATYDAVLVMERRRSVRVALKKLAPNDRQLVEDHHLEGMGYTEMAVLRDMTPNALRQRLFRARGRLAVELRRVGATLGVVPVTTQARFGRFFRRANDYSYAAGPVGVSALSLAAVAGVATVATVIGGSVAVPSAGAATTNQASAGTVAPVDREVAANRAAARARTTAHARPPAVARPWVDPPPIVTIPVTYDESGPIDPTKQDMGYSHRIVVDNPTGGPDFVYYQEIHTLPGQGISCYYDLPTCLESGPPVPPPQP